ncbi:hypothetical protein XMM379_000863 [Aliiroseovarius sp. xm-m-379]|nr:hypothetical protein [Aliiroseovarius sp. xm-d-517]NRP24183.1 hypothetical protein [Aliiroseovarius sp. xm-m-379]NRP30004.1 hypothetical protein [Aliiroseovarius sp. xm-m-314]NRP32982.1 hypothetical protein [Aliiroseovarius sp. xm-a-104]NRP40015.1 hypothetical protein [Aliiroseovarius sp. xm-m-339-2]NRP43283.1 hypothetical protein [Aliiroseovarius sp. xm-m-378]NRP49572.1 hypothetical protein [Aliiroseovarius sp. xm-m-354]NRP61021.1 hypothetical protein [Aliiroseovarius sp. xm-a-151]NRP64
MGTILNIMERRYKGVSFDFLIARIRKLRVWVRKWQSRRLDVDALPNHLRKDIGLQDMHRRWDLPVRSSSYWLP